MSRFIHRPEEGKARRREQDRAHQKFKRATITAAKDKALAAEYLPDTHPNLYAETNAPNFLFALQDALRFVKSY